MRKLLFTALCLFALLATSAGLKAQEITINLNHGWTWISYTRADTLTFPVFPNLQFGNREYEHLQCGNDIRPT